MTYEVNAFPEFEKQKRPEMRVASHFVLYSNLIPSRNVLNRKGINYLN